MFDLNTWLLALPVIGGIAAASWLVSLAKRDVSIVDSVWSLLIWAAAGVYAWQSAAVTQRGWLVLVLVTAWAVRLSVYITARNWGEGEDRRYQRIRANNQPHFWIKSLWIVFLLQGLLAWIISLPLLAAFGGAGGLGWLDLA
ncbi:MAG TPA: DUF1295 domain-containing protein, partial [Gammaproteobacteria bacterium]